jgi:hypothetical protein
MKSPCFENQLFIQNPSPMSLLRLTNGFHRLTDAALGENASYIASCIKDNPNFPTPTPTPVKIQEMVTQFLAAVDKAKTGNRMDILLKNDMRETLIETLYLAGYYVLFTAQGDRAIAASSGFKLAKEPKPAPAITKPDNLKVVNGNQTGMLETSVDAVKGALAYVHQYTTDPALSEDNWLSIPCTSRRCKLESLTPGTLYYVRVGAVGSKEQVLYSDVVSRIAA